MKSRFSTPEASERSNRDILLTGAFIVVADYRVFYLFKLCLNWPAVGTRRWQVNFKGAKWSCH